MTMFDAASANVRSNPRMSAAHEAHDFEVIFTAAANQALDVVTFCEIAYPRMRKALKASAKRHGYRVVGAHKGSENVVAYHPRVWTLKGHAIRFLSAGVRLLTPTRTATWCRFTGVSGTLCVAATHLVSGYQNPRSSRLSLRKSLARLEIRRVRHIVHKAALKGHLVLVAGDMNAQDRIDWSGTGTVQVDLYQGQNGAMGRMMQGALVHNRHWTVTREGSKEIGLDHLYTDHPAEIGLSQIHRA